MTPAAVDEIIMVGGSSRIPLVARRLRERFGREPRIIDPDLCVAAGAALKAARLGTFTSHLRLDPVPDLTGVDILDVGGAVLAGERVGSVAGVTVRLAAAHGGLETGPGWRRPWATSRAAWASWSG